MSDRIAQSLSKHFERHRIVFWYDAKRELRGDFEAVSLPGVEKLELANNEFAIKHRILREQPETRFLIYQEGPQPPDLENWLLDVQLAYKEFRTDQAANWLAELELGLEFAELVEAHAEFFRSAKRLAALKGLVKPDDSASAIRLKMVAVCAGAEPRLDAVLENLLQELSEGKGERSKLISTSKLEAFLWEQMTRCFGYRSEMPGIKDFALELFKSCYAMGLGGEVKLTGDALVFLKRWKDSRRFEASFEGLSAEYAGDLGIEQDLAGRDFRTLLDLDYFDLIDRKILSDLVGAVGNRTVSVGEVNLWVRQRRQSHWYRDFQDLYEAVDYAAKFLSTLSEVELAMDSVSEGVGRYTQAWFRVDQLYRKFVYHVRKSGKATLMGELAEKIENLYTNNFLLKLGDRFQACVEGLSKWEAPPLLRQKDFFEFHVQPFLGRGNKVCIIVSDAMRYEIGEELLGRIRQEDRYTASLEPMLAMLPSYTQLGMAALLPNQELALAPDDSGVALVDGQSSKGTANRTKILVQGGRLRATAMKAAELMAMKGDECRALVRDHDVLYVYHNKIDALGDKRETEEQVFEATEAALEDLVKLVKKLNSANLYNFLVTADHGFIYQNRPLEDSDFASVDATGDEVLFRDRRFVLGRGLTSCSSMHTFSSAQLGLGGELQVQIPKSINRLRLRGSGSRYVHGGATLQEVVVPLIHINKKRQSDVSSVDVDILPSGSSVITSGQVAVVLYQREPAIEKTQPRGLRAGIFTASGELISDCHDLTFDLVSENPRERELSVRFLLTRKADEANGQEVILRLEEKVAGTSHYKEYKTLRYTMRRSFTSDFEF